MNLRFHFASFIASIIVGVNKITVKNFLRKVNLDKIDDDLLNTWIYVLYDLFSKTKEELNLDSNRVARTKEFDRRILNHLKELHHKKLKK